MQSADAVILRGLTVANVSSSRPVIIQRKDRDFIESLLKQLASPPGLSTLSNDRVVSAGGGQPLRLYQPVHRVFHLVLLEIACDQFGEPRLDPQRIENAGFVMRRERQESTRNGFPTMEGWMESTQLMRGWVPFGAAENERLDPHPAFRKLENRIGQPFLDRLFSASANAALTEKETHLYVAPPEVCEATHKTILFGLIPVTSSEQSEAPDTSMPPFTNDLIRQHLPTYLRAGGPRSVPRAKQILDYTHADTSNENIKDNSDTDDLGDFILMLRQLSVEFEAFKEPLGSNPVYQAINQILLPFSTSTALGTTINIIFRPAGEFLKEALDILVSQRGMPAAGTYTRPDRPPAITMPDNFSEVTAEQAARILQSVKGVMIRRLGEIAGHPARFDDPGRRYRLRAFVRLKSPPGCPPVTVWSDYSEPFTIVPWYESGEAPPTQVILPDINPGFLKNLKPNVSFIVPEGLFNLLNKNSPQDFISGSASQARAQLAMDWICSFNIPVITICAFIVLNIFLQLFDFVFHWMLFIKICLPFPKTSR